MYNFCTLFDSYYLTRGIAMYESLKKHGVNFHLFILAFDEIVEKILKTLNFEDVTIISLQDFEDDELKKAKKDRTRGEYCWTCTPSLIKYCIEKNNLYACTYLDADIYFYNNPKEIFEEMEARSIMLSPHRYTPVYDRSDSSGIYCVQFVTFKNDNIGKKALNWWRNACIQWCYAREEEGKFGDQKYLDDWTERFEGVHVMKHKGGGVAPWNVQQYRFIKRVGDNIFLYDKNSSEEFPLIFYHFHNLYFLGNEKFYLGSYIIPAWAKKELYAPYILHLEKINEQIQTLEPGTYHRIYVNEKNLEDKFFDFIAKVNIFKEYMLKFFNFLIPFIKKMCKNKMPKCLKIFIKVFTWENNTYSISELRE